MKLAWIRLVFVLCTLSTLIYVGMGLACTLGNEGKAFIMANPPESASVFVGLILFHLGLTAFLHIVSFILTGRTEHLSCMFAWMMPPIAIFLVCFLCGNSTREGWETAFAIPCNGLAAFGLAAGTAGIVIEGVFGEHYEKLTHLP
jgi:hypothetical protein